MAELSFAASFSVSLRKPATKRGKEMQKSAEKVEERKKKVA
jgi:hypothetical protein